MPRSICPTSVRAVRSCRGPPREATRDRIRVPQLLVDAEALLADHARERRVHARRAPLPVDGEREDGDRFLAQVADRAEQREVVAGHDVVVRALRGHDVDARSRAGRASARATKSRAKCLCHRATGSVKTSSLPSSMPTSTTSLSMRRGQWSRRYRICESKARRSIRASGASSRLGRRLAADEEDRPRAGKARRCASERRLHSRRAIAAEGPGPRACFRGCGALGAAIDGDVFAVRRPRASRPGGRPARWRGGRTRR